MKWLETPHDEAERLLREGLDQATNRVSDEITHRRVWAKLTEAMEKPQPVAWGRLAVAGASLALLVGAGVIGVPKLLHLGKPVQSGDTFADHGTNRSGETAPQIPAVASNGASTAADKISLLESERIPGHVVRTLAGEHAKVDLGGGAEATLAENSAITWDAQHRPSVEKGSATLSVPHQPPGWRFSVTAGPYVVTVVGTKFEVRVADHTVGVQVTEGVVEVWRGSRSTRLVAGDSWNGPLNPGETAAAAPPSERPQAPALTPPRITPPPARGLQDAQAALQTGDVNRALEILTRTAAGSGPAAENAAYELGRITRYNLNRPRQAVALWDKYRTRFPSGLLRTEADLSIVDTLSSLGDVHAALAEADAFISRHPASERRLEVQRLAERLRAAESAAGSR